MTAIPIEFDLDQFISSTASQPEEVPIIHTRDRSVINGEQVDCTPTAKLLGIRYPVYMSKQVHDRFVSNPAKPMGTPDGRLICLMATLRQAATKVTGHEVFLDVQEVTDYRGIRLMATCGPRDEADPRPAITIDVMKEVV